MALTFATTLFTGLLAAPSALAAPLPAQVAESGSSEATVVDGVNRGDRLSPKDLGPVRIVQMRELNELQKSLPNPKEIRRARNGAQGEWIVPSLSTAKSAHSGSRYIMNKWGDASVGIGFGETIDLDGVWVAGQTGPSVWAKAVRAIGFRDGQEVAKTEWFEKIGAEHAWFALDLPQVDRVVFEAQGAVGGAGWYALDDLSFRSASGETVVLDFEDLDYKAKLREANYRGFDWEIGTGEFTGETRSIEQPLIDPSMESQTSGNAPASAVAAGTGTAPSVISTISGSRLGDPGAGFIPPDTVGAVGIDHFVEAVNSNLSVFEKTTGARVVNISLATLFGIGGGGFAGDPRVVFDPDSERFIVIGTDFGDRIYLGVSMTSDPTGAFFTTFFITDGGVDAGDFPDYPTLGVDNEGIYVGLNQFGGGVTGTIFAIDKAPLIAASPSLGTITAFRELPTGGTIQPTVNYDDPGVVYLISFASGSSLQLSSIDGPLTAPTLTDIGTVDIPAFGFPPDVEALGSTVPLDSVDSRLMNAIYRNGSVWAAHAVDVDGRAAARWYEADPVTLTAVQVGTVADSELGLVMPTIAVNSRGDAVIGMTGASPTQFGSAFFAGRLATDPLSATSGPVEYRAGENFYEIVDGAGRNRWGDYSLTSVDPVDDLTFWTVQEYAGPEGDLWDTEIAEIRFDFADCNNNGIDDLIDIANDTSSDLNANETPDECELVGGNFCVAAANSAGPGANIAAVGSDSVAANDFILTTEGLPSGVSTLYFFGTNQIQTSFGDGFRCVGGTVRRLPPTAMSSSAGELARPVDLSVAPAAGLITPGSTWNFQCWYRDPMGPGGTGFNLSDGLSVSFQ